MQQLLQSRGLNGSWEQILNLGPSLNHTAFTRTPYIDPLGEYTNLNEYGDLEVPLIVLSTNETNVQNIHYLGDPSHAFGRTTEDGSSFIEYFKPTFYGGKLTPPKDDDDKVELDIVTEGSPHGIAIRLFQALAGLSITVMMAISLWRALTKVQRDAPPLWTWMVIVAGSLGVASTFWSIGSSAIQMCFVASLLFVEGVSIYLGCGLYLLVRRAWLYYNTEKMFRSLRVGRFALVIGMFMAVDACLVLFYRFSRYLASENKVCGPLRVTGQMDFRLALGIIHILGLCAVLALLVTFKPRRSSSTFDNIFKVTSVFLIAVIIFELILRPSKIQTVLEAVTLNAIPVFACVLVIIQKPEKPFPWDEEPKRVKVLRCNDMGKMRISIQGRFGWREERKYFVHLWNRSGLPWMTFTELDGTTTHRVDLAKLRSRDVYTDENPDPSDMVLEQMTVRNGILLMLPNSCIMLRLKTADGRDKMVGFLTGFARMNETKASQVSMLVGTGGSHREWKSELTGFDEA
ncbi:hypothetical protein BC829DRAFT_203213 [Chytridium lagenaria]|nr:hypothetical protein BC829DRAFT_203213 [Chytridium lagenaria]